MHTIRIAYRISFHLHLQNFLSNFPKNDPWNYPFHFSKKNPIEETYILLFELINFPDRRARCRGTIRFFCNWQVGHRAATLWSTCIKTTSIIGRKRKWPSTIKSRTPESSGPFITGCRIGCTKVSFHFTINQHSPPRIRFIIHGEGDHRS